MSTKVFVNLPVKDLKKSKEFFGALGFTFNPQFTNDDAACMVISEHNYAMLLTEAYFKTFATKPVADAHTSTEVLIALGSTAGLWSMRWSTGRCKWAATSRGRFRTTVSCWGAASRTLTDTCGKSCGWIRRGPAELNLLDER